ncbi:PREDICTED: trypsin-1-like [Ceratosolen solmsi marchali]|uniref:Trypsin-1-like n=1 Tax=Ceratosolen solmsi marchali TaxID=326594 RepID=A0AAJ6YQB6_9HYME|nr:PREDICTED: trypsin-1-like [Ceratosolen solmsi marchali]
MYILVFFTLTISIIGQATKPDLFEDEKIVGGNVVTIQQYPYQISILVDNYLWCGGSILSKYSVLTAAHCILTRSNELIVHAGSSFWMSGGSYHRVKTSFVYGNELSTDLSVLRIKEPFVFNSFCQPIKIAAQGKRPTASTMATVSGWGNTNYIGISNQLRAVQVPIVNQYVCNKIYRLKNVTEIFDSQICAGYLKTGGKDACQGDSGGPLVIDGVQYGIVSMGLGCAEPYAPGVYTDVSYFSDWIYERSESIIQLTFDSLLPFQDW